MVCPKAKAATYCLYEFFPIYQNEHWTITWWEDHRRPIVPLYYIEDCQILDRSNVFELNYIFLNNVPLGENWPASIEPYVAFL